MGRTRPSHNAEWIANWVSQNASSTRKVLDVAASHGIFGVEIAKRVPQAQITALDWANVLTVAQETAEAAGIKDRYRTLPGSAFERSIEELSARLAFVNFEGAKALAASETVPIDQPLTEDFIRTHCAGVTKAIEKLVSWLE